VQSYSAECWTLSDVSFQRHCNVASPSLRLNHRLPHTHVCRTNSFTLEWQCFHSLQFSAWSSSISSFFYVCFICVISFNARHSFVVFFHPLVYSCTLSFYFMTLVLYIWMYVFVCYLYSCHDSEVQMRHRNLEMRYFHVSASIDFR
jgi:hypothetical protein